MPDPKPEFDLSGGQKTEYSRSGLILGTTSGESGNGRDQSRPSSRPRSLSVVLTGVTGFR